MVKDNTLFDHVKLKTKKTMKQISEVQAELDELLKLTPQQKESMSKTELSRATKRVGFLKIVKNYLEQNPREGYVKEQLDKLEEKVKKIDGEYQVWLDGCENPKDTSEMRKAYNSQTGALSQKEKYNEQLKMLREVLG